MKAEGELARSAIAHLLARELDDLRKTIEDCDLEKMREWLKGRGDDPTLATAAALGFLTHRAKHVLRMLDDPDLERDLRRLEMAAGLLGLTLDANGEKFLREISQERRDELMDLISEWHLEWLEMSSGPDEDDD